MTKQLGVAVIGAGFTGGIHLIGWSMVPEAKIISVSDLLAFKKLKEIKKYKAKVYKDYHDAIDRKDINVVDICTPTTTHKTIAVEAAKAGKNILLETPIALSLKDADAIIDATKRAGVKLMVAHVIRFFSEYLKVKELMDKGTLGEPIIARAHRAGPLPGRGIKSWFKDQKMSGGVSVDLAIHDIDFMRYIFSDDVKRVYAKVGRFVRKDATMDDHMLMLLRFHKGGIAHLEASWAVPQEYPFTYAFELAGTKSFVNFNNHETKPVTIMAKKKVEQFSPVMEKWIPEIPFPIDPYYREIHHFVDCLLQEKEPLTSGMEARSALEISLAAQKSSKTGQPINLPLEV